MEFNLEGFEKLQKTLQKLAKDVDKDKQEPILEGAAKVIADQARQNAPEDSGLLKSSITTKLMPRSDRYPTIAIAAVDRKKAPHAHLVEFGTSRAQANPFFRSAWDSKQGEVLDLIQNELSSIVKRWGR